MNTKPTEAEVSAELDRLEAMHDDDCWTEGLRGAITALRERLTPGQVTSMVRGEHLEDEDVDTAMAAANWAAGLSAERPSAQFA